MKFRSLHRSMFGNLTIALFAAAFSAGFLSPTVLCADERVSIEGVHVGFSGRYKVGDWTPVWVTLRAGDESRQVRVQLETADPDGQVAVFPVAQPVSLDAGQQRRVLGYVLPGRLRPTIAVTVHAAGEDDQASLAHDTQPLTRRELAAAEGAALLPALRQDESLILTLGHPEGLEDALGDSTPRDQQASPGSSPGAPYVVHLESVAELPDDHRGYAAVDVLVCATRMPWYEELSLAQSEALVQWVRSGGRIVIAVAEAWEAVADSFLAELLPAQLDGPPYEARQLIYLEAYSESRVPLVIDRTMPIASLDNVHGTVLASEGPRPLAVRAVYGFGRATLVTFDVDRSPAGSVSPFADWGGRGAFWQKLIELSSTAGAARRQGQSLARLRIGDLATQLRQTIEEFPEVQTVSFGWVLLIGVLYLAVAGPLDYVVVRRLLRRSGLMWLTLPVIVVAAVGTIYWIAAGSKGTTLRVHQVDLVDYDEELDFLRGSTFFALFSPQTESYDLTLAPAWGSEPAPAASLRWFGVPEEAVGGLYSSGISQLASSRYHVDPSRASIDGAPVPVWSIRSYMGQWQAEGQGLVESRLESPDGQLLDGTIRLSDHYAGALEDVLIAYGRRVYEMGELRSGTAFDLRALGRQRDLRGLLTGAFAVREESGDDALTSGPLIRATPYDAASNDLEAVMRMVLWHGAAGGAGYTGLQHQLLEFADLSDHLDLDRAVLVGRWVPADDTPWPAAVLHDGAAIDGAIDRAVYVRLVMPVEGAPADETAALVQ